MDKAKKRPISTTGNIKAIAAGVFPRLQPVIDSLLSNHPYWAPAFQMAAASYTFYMAFRQEEVNELVEFIASHPDKFRKEIVESKEFKDGFVVFFQEYLKIRVAQKRKVAQEIFLGFTECEDKEGFELERFNDSLLKISPRSIKTLGFFKKNIFPLKEKTLRERIKNENIEHSGKSKEWWFEFYWKKEALSQFIQSWLHENFNPNSQKVKDEYGVKEEWDKALQEEVFEKERKKSEDIYLAIDELVQLGILKIRVASGGGFSMGGGAEYDFSDFGYKFTEYIGIDG